MSKPRKIKVYTCGIDYQHELENDYIKVFGSIEQLKRYKKCWEECGIVELEVSLSKWAEPQNLFKNTKK